MMHANPGGGPSKPAIARSLSPASRLIKRGFDLLVATTAFALLLPLFALIAWSIKSSSAGTVFYSQPRAGERRKIFRIYKFRTMVEDADARLADVLHLNLHLIDWGDGRLYKIPGDPRITRVGAFLRRYSLDELPQLMNVIRGDMSLIGPRPLMLAEDQHVAPTHPRTTVKPGITGPWQVSGRNELSFEEMMRLDALYVTQWSFARDLRLMLLTVPVVLRPQRAP